MLRGEEGFSIVESLIAALLMAVALNVVLLGLSTGMVATTHSSQRVTAQIVARSQIEYVKTVPYAESYPVSESLFPDVSWQAVITATEVLNNLQKIEVEVSQNSSPVLTLEGMKGNR